MVFAGAMAPRRGTSASRGKLGEEAGRREDREPFAEVEQVAGDETGPGVLGEREEVAISRVARTDPRRAPRVVVYPSLVTKELDEPDRLRPSHPRAELGV